MVTLTFKKRPRPPFRIGCRVRAIGDACDCVFNEGAEGIVIEIDERRNVDNRTTAHVKFDKGNFNKCRDNMWWGYREDFVVIG